MKVAHPLPCTPPKNLPCCLSRWSPVILICHQCLPHGHSGHPSPTLAPFFSRARPSSLLISLAELSHHREVLEVGDFHKAKPLNPRAASLSSQLLQSARNPPTPMQKPQSWGSVSPHLRPPYQGGSSHPLSACLSKCFHHPDRPHKSCLKTQLPGFDITDFKGLTLGGAGLAAGAEFRAMFGAPGTTLLAWGSVREPSSLSINTQKWL